MSTPEQSQYSADATENLPMISDTKVSRWSLAYDIIMLGLIVIDLTMIMVDAILMSNFGADVASWIGMSTDGYKTNWHPVISKIGAWFTIVLIWELLIRWAWAIITKRYYRWFFFPFVHWYEVLGCFPQLRALRLLRAVAIGYGFYKLGYRFLPESWVRTGKFYYNIVLEEISDRVILIALNSVESEIKESDAVGKLIKNLINSNRPEIQNLVSSILQEELAPALKKHASLTQEGIGNAVHRALANVPDLSNYLRMIPIAGRLIESQIQNIGQNVAESIAKEVLQTVYSNPENGKNTNDTFDLIGKEVSNISDSNEALENLVSSVVYSTLETIREQIQIQQWKEKQDEMNTTV